MSTSRPTGAEEQRTCPSARCEEGSLLIGIVGGDGLVGYLRPALPVDADFVRIAAEGREAEQRLRFASPCVEGSCRHWTGRQCGLIDSTLEEAQGRELPGPDRLPRCSIRSSCRWFGQRGADACAVCPLVITEHPAP